MNVIDIKKFNRLVAANVNTALARKNATPFRKGFMLFNFKGLTSIRKMMCIIIIPVICFIKLYFIDFIFNKIRFNVTTIT